MTGATEAVTPPTPEEIAYVLYDAVRHMRPAEARAEIAEHLREAEANALRRAIALVQDRNVHGYISDIGCYGCFDRIENAIRSLLPKEEGK